MSRRNLFVGALRAEARKALASPVGWVTGLAVVLFPLIGAGFMLIVRDPEAAKSLGLIGTKARLSGLTADWPAYLGFISQAMCAGFLFLEALFVSWIFGREWSDRTLKLLLAVPAGRGRIVGAKFAVTALWGLAALGLLGATTLGVGGLLNLPQGSETLWSRWAVQFAVGGVLTLILGTWTAFFAGWGRGYLIPVAWTLVTLMAAQLGSVLGWGAAVPWAIPALAALGGPEALEPGSWGVALGTAALGVAATVLFWIRADHHR
jgi:ABC-2 type transport system permease protein